MTLKLRVSEICKKYGGNPVLEGCSFSFNEGGVYVLMGPNGSGKSTFLRICALLEKPDRGVITYYDGAAENNCVNPKQRITLMLPGVGVFNTTVFKNVAYGLKIRRMDKGEIHKRVEKALDLVNLGHRGHQNALTLSSGETQRLGMARALAIEPDILFLDEPTAFIDAGNRDIIENVILKMKIEGHPKVIMSTHDTRQAKRLGGVILMLTDGKISED